MLRRPRSHGYWSLDMARQMASTSARMAVRLERASYGDVLLVERLRGAIAKLNPALNAETRAEVLAKLVQTVTPSLVEENRRLHRYMVEGVPVEVRRTDG